MSVPYDIMPLFPFVTMSVGGKDIILNPPEHLIDFSFEKTSVVKSGYSGCNFSFTLYDDTAIQVEEILNRGYDEVQFKYGYNYNDAYSSALLGGMITEYSLNFESGGVILDVTGITKQIYDNAQSQKSISYDASTYHGKQSDIVRAIATEMDWGIGKIEETTTSTDDSGAEKTYNRTNQSALDFINKYLCEDAVSSSSGETGYYAYLDENGNIFYEPISNRSNVSSTTVTGDTYEFYCGRSNSSVISFSPEYKGSLGFTRAGNLQVASIDGLSNDMLELSVTNKPKDVGKYKTLVGMSSSGLNSLKNSAVNMWNTYASMSYYNATLELIGDPKIEVQSCIKIYVYTKQGFLHHTSGIYRVNSVTDEISGGTFTSSLSLQKTGDVNGKAVGVNPLEVSQTQTDTSIRIDPSTISGNDVVSIAQREIGNAEPTGDDKYISWYGGFALDVAWCAIFVSWCANQAGLINSGQVPKYASVSNGMQWFKDQGKFKYKGSYIPKRGDIFFQKSNGASHTGFVVSCDGSNYVTIEGNCSDAVKSITRSLSDSTLTGFGVWQ